MLNKIFITTIFTALLISGCNTGEINKDEVTPPLSEESATSKYIDSIVYSSESLVIRKISNHVYVHTSYLQTESFGKVPCNGMVVADNNDAIVFDTPTDSISSEELIQYLSNELQVNVKGIISTHFHKDCVGGLKEFHQHKIPSYAERRTIRILKEKMKESPFPQNEFMDSLELSVGELNVFAGFFGGGHTVDNIVGYFPGDNILFGGCLIKESGAGKGNLEDANVSDWPGTVQKLQKRFPKTNVVIPGHGERGGTELFDYTIGLFSPGS